AKYISKVAKWLHDGPFNKSDAHPLRHRYIYLKVFKNKREQIVRVDLTTLLYIENEKNYLTLHLDNEKIIIRHTLQGILPELNQYFIRIHKSYIINIDRIQFIEKAAVVLDNHLKVPLSARHRSRLLDTIQKFRS
ncbi:MAG: LytTR family DNA-binding domain-containing protein, partial [Tunicatimonas sp.]|uniref:LytR/AlgR family response regulator transcription factor n=1 Tax=Tunicatimonas sp. TaxID=1940096 RepID=UPI003C738778